MNPYDSTPANFAQVAAKIIGSTRANIANGVPQLLSQEMLQTPPWESNMYNVEFSDDQREEYSEWLFIGLYPIPDSTSSSSGFKWEGGPVKTIGEVRHCLFKPSPGDGGKWELHQYSSPELMGKAVYLMHRNK
ncbi:unnamed protein product [Microthlaspi erraticum]|uniref:Uncharacterized protein n=1 Tax=Microthlaspi erraticum TaxID=1685480 RepID=A0A6D2K9K5_9BRAS|nr:unnamed protein product [Microthlaspi erraticum]CAA7044459.1 unnamed protein product [Microthlaspi erraticum]